MRTRRTFDLEVSHEGSDDKHFVNNVLEWFTFRAEPRLGGGKEAIERGVGSRPSEPFRVMPEGNADFLDK